MSTPDAQLSYLIGQQKALAEFAISAANDVKSYVQRGGILSRFELQEIAEGVAMIKEAMSRAIARASSVGDSIA